MGKKKEKSQDTCPGWVQIFKWLLRNGMNEANINGIKTKILLQHSQRLDARPSWDSNIKGP